MQPSLFLIFNHEITDLQKKDAFSGLGIRLINELPRDIKVLWSQIPPEIPELNHYLTPVRTWLELNSAKGDYVLIQGDFGACFNLVNFSFRMGLIPIYSTTERKVLEACDPDGTVKLTHQFKHRIFRRYGL